MSNVRSSCCLLVSCCKSMPSQQGGPHRPRFPLRFPLLVQEGLANVCLVGASVTVVKAKIEANLPRKRGAASAGYDKAINSFNEKVGLYSLRATGESRQRRVITGSVRAASLVLWKIPLRQHSSNSTMTQPVIRPNTGHS